MGCGRVGARVAMSLDSVGHSVAIIDRSPSAFERLDDDFTGQKITGDGFHRDVLERAGIAEAYAFAAVTDGDNSNVIAARTVSAVYGVERIVARIYDPDRAELFERKGIPTIASVTRTATAVLKRILPPNTSTVWQDLTGAVSLVLIRPGAGWVGKSFGAIERATGTRIAFVARLAGVLVATDRMAVQEYDELYIAMNGDDSAPLRKILSNAPAGDMK